MRKMREDYCRSVGLKPTFKEAFRRNMIRKMKNMIKNEEIY